MYITIEGIDGAGKTTLVSKLNLAFQERGYKVKKIKEPFNEGIKKIIEDIKECESLPSKDKSLALAHLFATDRLVYSKQIYEKYNKSHILLSDRSKYSSMAYQLDVKFGHNRILNLTTPEPDLLVYLDIMPQVAMKRIESRGGNIVDVFEKEEYLQQVYENYDKILWGIRGKPRVLRTDVNVRSENEVFEEIGGRIFQFMEEEK